MLPDQNISNKADCGMSMIDNGPLVPSDFESRARMETDFALHVCLLRSCRAAIEVQSLLAVHCAQCHSFSAMAVKKKKKKGKEIA